MFNLNNTQWIIANNILLFLYNKYDLEFIDINYEFIVRFINQQFNQYSELETYTNNDIKYWIESMSDYISNIIKENQDVLPVF